jgi:hypothetical protein
MELPTQYLALLLYPNATYYLAESYYTPVSEMIAEAREEAGATLETDSYLDAEAENEPDAADETEALAAQGLTYVIPYERLYELCEGLDYVTTDDDGYYRVYYYFDTLLAALYASEIMTDTLSNLEAVLDVLDPEQNGMTVVETGESLTCTIGQTEVFRKTVTGGVTEISLRLPVPLNYELTFDYRRENTGNENRISASASVVNEGALAVSLTLTGEGLPAEGALGGEGSVTAVMDGYVFEQVPPAQTIAFRWSRTAAQLPYELSLTADWINPQTGLPALSVYFNGSLSARDKSVFQEVVYEQNDFFGLNDMFLREHKERWAKTIGLYLLPIALQMPGGVIDDMVNFMIDKDILISLIE